MAKRRIDECRVCGDPKPIVAHQLCGTCHQYRRRTGHDRPEEVQVAHGRRLLERRR